MELERIALQDEYFTKRKLYPNVDFYTGIMLRAIGIPTSMFTVMFAMSRTVGWVSHWREMVSEGQMRIGRPRQIYGGIAERSFQPRRGGWSLRRRNSLGNSDSMEKVASFSQSQAQAEIRERAFGHRHSMVNIELETCSRRSVCRLRQRPGQA
mmetsp:Transcript_41633/g.117766  ORF Transcript_41633/g.117766 Transcript_41633/m.117766 type:complete len:153 (+) Transcript_41633:2-460(+)